MAIHGRIMKTKLIKHPLATSETLYPVLLEKLEKQFHDWKFADMGGLSKFKNSVHFHITSKNKQQNGVVEITMSPQFSDKIEVKLASNRETEWSIKSFQQLINYLKQND